MTIPKTHPLYGAVEALYKTNRLLTWNTCEDAIRALEAAGYRVVGPEPTEAMIAECQGDGANHPVMKYLTPEERSGPLFPLAHWRAHFAAAPTITETEKTP